MIPGMNMNSKQMKQAMKKMGVKQEELDAISVVIRLKDKDLVIDNPSVQKVDMMGQKSFQVSGEVAESVRQEEVLIDEGDIAAVVEATGVSAEQAKEALGEASGDIAAAIIALKEE